MDRIKMTKTEMTTRGGILDELMDKIFDVAMIIDDNYKIINLSKGAFPDETVRAKYIGENVAVLDNVSPFEEVINHGVAATGLLLEIQGRKCVSNVFPIEDQGKIIGAVGTIVFRSLKRVKRLFANSEFFESSEVGELYSNIARVEGGYAFDDFIGEDPSVIDLIEKAKKAAASKLPILIIGETGTGKEIISGAIHNSRFAKEYAPYVTINCTAIPENLLESELFGHEKGAFTGADRLKLGKFELASGGDILLDEIGDMDLNMQSKLLRVLESREFERVGGSKVIPLNAGIIASTNKNLFILSEEKKFRDDLYYRLNAIELFIPPLRRRPKDIPVLINHFSDELEVNLKFTDKAISSLMDYSWPGNVRQLKNLTQRLSIFYEGKQIDGLDISKELRVGQRTFNEAFGVLDDDNNNRLTAMENSEQSLIEDALMKNGGNISAAAKEIGISRGTMYNKIRKYNLGK